MTIKPELLDIIVDYCAEPTKEGFSGEHPLIMFSENLQAQLADATTGKQITGFSDDNYRHMKRVAKRLTKSGQASGALVALKLSTLNTRILESDYSFDDSYSDWLHYEFVPEILANLEQYAKDDLGDEGLANKVKATQQQYSERYGIE